VTGSVVLEQRREGEAHTTGESQRMEDPDSGEVVRRRGMAWTGSMGELGGSDTRSGWRRKWRRRGARSAAGGF
jgi:hypothetical protein